MERNHNLGVWCAGLRLGIGQAPNAFMVQSSSITLVQMQRVNAFFLFVKIHNYSLWTWKPFLKHAYTSVVGVILLVEH